MISSEVENQKMRSDLASSIVRFEFTGKTRTRIAKATCCERHVLQFEGDTCSHIVAKNKAVNGRRRERDCRLGAHLCKAPCQLGARQIKNERV